MGPGFAGSPSFIARIEILASAMEVAVLSNGRTMQDSKAIEGQYANYFQVGQNAIEFLIEFGQLYEGEVNPKFHTRIITSPEYAKELRDLLQKSLAEYEARFGPVREV